MMKNINKAILISFFLIISNFIHSQFDYSYWALWKDYNHTSVQDYSGITEDPSIGKLFFLDDQNRIRSLSWDGNEWTEFVISYSIKAEPWSKLWFSSYYDAVFFINTDGYLSFFKYNTYYKRWEYTPNISNYKVNEYSGLTENKDFGKFYYINSSRSICNLKFNPEFNTWEGGILHGLTTRAYPGSDILYSKTRGLFFIDEDRKIGLINWTSEKYEYKRIGTYIANQKQKFAYDEKKSCLYYISSSHNIIRLIYENYYQSWMNENLTKNTSVENLVPSLTGLEYHDNMIFFRGHDDHINVLFFDAGWKCELLNGEVSVYNPSDLLYSTTLGKLFFTRENKKICSLNSTKNPIPKPGWNLVYSDEFENEVDTEHWYEYIPWRGNNSINKHVFLDNIDFLMTSNNIDIKDGFLEISTIKHYKPYHGYDYSTGAIWSKRRYKYGYFEARLKMENSDAYWPAFWLFGNNFEEFDIYENTKGPSTWCTNYHLETYDGNNPVYNISRRKDFENFATPNLAKRYHTVSLEWSPDEATYRLNNISHRIIQDNPAPNYPIHLPKGKMAIIVDDNIRTPSNDKDKVIFSIDYIRVYSKTNNDFEKGFGNYFQSKNDDFDWEIGTGNTPSKYTGPTNAYNSGGKHFAYVEASYPNYPNKKAILNTNYDLTSYKDPSLSFKYHMYGSNMGKLTIKISNGGTINEHHINGNKGNEWHIANINLSEYENQIIDVDFIAETGNGYASDIAIDDIEVIENWHESFEQGYQLWSNYSVLDNNSNPGTLFLRYSGATPSYNTGPSSASDGNYYLYVEATPFKYCKLHRFVLENQNSNCPHCNDEEGIDNVSYYLGHPNKQAFLKHVFELDYSEEVYLTFDYHMNGVDMDDITTPASLAVYARELNNGSFNKIWEVKGQSSTKNWNEAVVDISEYNSPMVELRIYATTGKGYRSDIAIDNIKILFNSEFLDNKTKSNFVSTNIIETPITKIDSNIEIFPNPAKDHFFLSHDLDEILELKIYTIEGILTSHHRVEKKFSRINVQNLNEGVYLISIKSVHNTSTKKIILK